MWKWLLACVLVGSVASAYQRSNNPTMSGVADLLSLITLLLIIRAWREYKKVKKGITSDTEIYSPVYSYSKWLPIVLVGLLGLIILGKLFGVGVDTFSNNSEPIEKKLIEFSNIYSRQLPKMLDPNTRLDSVLASKKSVTLKYTFVSSEIKDVDANILKKGVYSDFVTKACGSPKIKELLDLGATVKYTYFDNNNVYITEIDFSKADCDIH